MRPPRLPNNSPRAGTAQNSPNGSTRFCRGIVNSLSGLRFQAWNRFRLNEFSRYVRKGSLPGSAANERACLRFTPLSARVMHSPHERQATAARKAARWPAPKIYYLHPLLAGPLSGWERHIERARRMGFGHLATAPLFAPGGTGDIFLAADHDRVHRALGV